MSERLSIHDEDHWAYRWGRTRLIEEIEWLREQHEREAATIKEMAAMNRELRGDHPRGESLPQWCPICKTYHDDVGVTTDAGRVVRECPLVSTDDPRYYGSAVYSGDR